MTTNIPATKMSVFVNVPKKQNNKSQGPFRTYEYIIRVIEQLEAKQFKYMGNTLDRLKFKLFIY